MEKEEIEEEKKEENNYEMNIRIAIVIVVIMVMFFSRIALFVILNFAGEYGILLKDSSIEYLNGEITAEY